MTSIDEITETQEVLWHVLDTCKNAIENKKGNEEAICIMYLQAIGIAATYHIPATPHYDWINAYFREKNDAGRHLD